MSFKTHYVTRFVHEVGNIKKNVKIVRIRQESCIACMIGKHKYGYVQISIHGGGGGLHSFIGDQSL